MLKSSSESVSGFTVIDVVNGLAQRSGFVSTAAGVRALRSTMLGNSQSDEELVRMIAEIAISRGYSLCLDGRAAAPLATEVAGSQPILTKWKQDLSS